MFELRELTGQEYVDQYCKRASDEPVDVAEPARLRTAAEVFGPGGGGDALVVAAAAAV